MKSRRPTNLIARGEPMVWLSGGCVAAAALMILALLAFIAINGFSTFWPGPVERVDLKNGKVVLGEPTRVEQFIPEGANDPVGRTLYKTGNYDISGDDYVWVRDDEIASKSRPEFALVIERTSWGNAYGVLDGVVVAGETVNEPKKAWARYLSVHPKVQANVARIKAIEKNQIGAISDEQNELRLELKKVELKSGVQSEAYKAMERPKRCEKSGASETV